MNTLDVKADIIRLGYKSYNKMVLEEAIKPCFYGFIIPLIVLICFKSIATGMILVVIACAIQKGVQKNSRKAKRTALIGMIIPGFIAAILVIGMMAAAL